MRADINGLKAVRSELDLSLERARQGLETYIEEEADALALENCLLELHQVQGGLEILRLHAASLLVADMQAAIRAIKDGVIEADESLFEVLFGAGLQLSDYLDYLPLAGIETDLVLQPVINELRVATERPVLGEDELFIHVLREDPVEPVDTPVNGSGGDLVAMARKTLPQFQAALLGVIKQREGSHLQRLGELATGLQSVGENVHIQRLWWLTAALVEAIKDEGLIAGIEIKRLLGQLSMQLHTLAVRGEQALTAPVYDLEYDLLYQVGRSTANGALVQGVRKAYALNELLPSKADLEAARARLRGPNTALLHTLATEIRNDLAIVRDNIDLLMRSGELSAEHNAQTSDALNRVAATLAMLGQTELQRVVQRQAKVIEAGHSKPDPADPAWQSAATTLLWIDHSLDHILLHPDQAEGDVGPALEPEAGAISPQELRLGTQSILREALVNLGRVQEQVSEYASSGEGAVLEAAPGLLYEVAAGLDMLGQNETAGMLHRLQDSIKALADNPDRIGRVADALSDTSKLLEALRDDHVDSEALVTELGGYLDALDGGAPPPAEPVPDEAPGEDLLEPDMPGDVEEAPQAATASELPAPSADDEIRNVFLEELGDIQVDLSDQLPAWQSDRSDHAALGEVRRAFHTLKGSGRMVAAEHIGEYGWAVENLLNRCLDGSLEVSDELAELVDAAIAGLPALVQAYTQGEELPAEAMHIIASAHGMAGSEVPAAYRTGAAPVEPQPVELEAAGVGAEETESAAQAIADAVPAEAQSEAAELRQIFTQDALEHLEHIAGFLAEAGPHLDPLMVSHQVVRAFHTLKSGSSLAGLDQMSSLAAELEVVSRRALNEGEPLGTESLQILQEATDGLLATMEAYQAAAEPPDLSGLIQDIRELHVAAEEETAAEEAVSAALLAFTEEAYELTEQLEARLRALESAAGNQDERDRLMAGLQALGDSAQSAGIEAIAVLADRMRDKLGTLTEVGSAQCEILAEVSMGVYGLLDDLREGQQVLQANELLLRLDELDAIAGVSEAEEAEEAVIASDELPDQAAVYEADTDEVPTGTAAPEEAIVSQQPPAEETPAEVEEAVQSPEAWPEESEELAALFQDEAEDLLEGIDRALDDLDEQPENAEPAAELLRLLHTIKGGARMAGAPGIADLGHELENQIEARTRTGQVPDSNYLSGLRAQVDQMHGLLDAFRRPAKPAASKADKATATIKAGPSTWAESLYWQPDTAEQATSDGSGESARVPVASLDKMLNEAGEISIYRGRMEQQHADLEAQLVEFEQAVERLRRLLRELDKETDAQVRARREQLQESADRYDAEFDPLEMDRYTRMNELSRSLNESAADLASLHGLMDEATHDAETLLLQQGRVATSLQHGLMDTLLVPFSRQVQRLQRLVRQTCQSHSRSARLEFEGEENELDRNVLDRMAGPLEHLLRNAVVHGIEDAKLRKKAGKPEEGEIRVSLRRDGTQSIIEVSDDGGGLDIKAIRKQAEARGLVPKGRKIDEDVLRQFIFEPGFSTAAEVTQEAGRGVGMDVVNAEIKQLGGTITVFSEAGKGTRFTIRIPSSLAISNALLVRVGHEQYAIPMASIDGIERVARESLEAELAAGDAAEGIKYGGQSYRVARLTDYLGMAHSRAEDDEETRNLPVLLIQAGDIPLALIVDQVLGGQELVVKSLGPQVSAIAGIKGGAILADGSVILILDIQALYQAQRRRGLVAEQEQAAAIEQVMDQRPMVMVVDDSITIRRVTEKFLLRNGYRVCTAKDGMDALPKLQTEAPDLVLLDIEMPRIDGFEFATYMRNSEQFVNIPIIMITSRSGEKHKQRAAKIGVQEYIVKPYQEDALLTAIKDVLERAQVPV